MKTDGIVDLTGEMTDIVDCDCLDCSSTDEFESCIVNDWHSKTMSKNRVQQIEEDSELASSLQISEYINSMRKVMLKNKKKTKKISSNDLKPKSQISSFFRKTDITDKSDISLQEDDDIKIEKIEIKDNDGNRKSKKRLHFGKESDEELIISSINMEFIHNVISPELELLDPTPNIILLFNTFNREFFYNSLKFISVKWSKRMTLCAGICRMKGVKIGITLSEPLLSLRQRSDTVNTLLHEMIHAYLFVTHNYFDHNDHGDEFKKHMKRINDTAKSDITIYHAFHDEVEHNRKWWWRCDGTCRGKPPYFGYVKRAMNRPPQPADWWFEKHQTECGGVYHLVKKPDEKKKATVDSLFHKK